MRRLPIIPFLCLAGLLGAQLPTAFDAVSIRPAAPGQNGSTGRSNPGRLTFFNMIPLRLIELAYNIQAHAIDGPAWLGQERYDITATVSAPLTRPQMLPLLRGVLADRFAMRAHMETRTLAVYRLEVAKGGAKLQAAGAAFRCDSSAHPELVSIVGTYTTAALAASLAQQTDRPVVDATGLQGDFSLCFGYASDPAVAGADTGAPDLFAAVRDQLGLQLKAGHAPVAVLVIDHIERPTAN